MQSEEIIEKIRQMFPKATDEQIDKILWTQTAFPVGGIELILKQLQKYIDLGPLDGIEGRSKWGEEGCPYV